MPSQVHGQGTSRGSAMSTKKIQIAKPGAPREPLKAPAKRGRKPLPAYTPKQQRAPQPKPEPIGIKANNYPQYYDHSGKPRIQLSDEESGQLKGMITVGCPMEECAAILGVSKDTLERNYMDVIKATRLIRNAKVRRKQYDMAMDGNTGMLVWLGKQWLGQSDEVNLHTPDGGAGMPVIELVFVDSDGDGRPKHPEQLQIGPGTINAG